MPSFVYVYEADLTPLATAAESWKALPAKYESLHDEFTRRVITHLEGHWEGDAAEAAFSTMKKARKQYEDAATEAGRIAKLLNDAHGEFAKFQKQLHTLIDEAPADGFRISDKGAIEDVDERWNSPTASSAEGFATERKEALDALESRMKRILELATAADEAASAALERDANGDNNTSFNTSVYTSLDAIEADQASHLMKKKGRLTDVEFDRLNAVLSANRNDPEFASRFALRTGADNTLERYNELVNPPAGTHLSKKELAELKSFQRNLGTTLGTATRSDDNGKPNPGITKFQNDLLASGQHEFNANPTQSAYGLNGYQLTGSLMSHGKWDTDFLQDYGDDLITAEKNGTAGGGKNPDAYWSGDNTRTSGLTNIVALDPMTGFMEGLGHNPEASTEFLTGSTTVDSEEIDRLDYLLKDRHWPEGAAYTGDAKHPSGYDSLGHAMESATTGRSNGDEDAAPVKHSPERAALMHDIVNTVGAEPGMLAEDGRNALRDSLGNMTADYMADVQGAIANEQGTITPFGADADLDMSKLQPFLGAVGQDPDAYAAITQAQQAHSAVLMQRVIESDPTQMTEALQNVAHPGAVVAGIMADGRTQAIHEAHSASDADYNNAVATTDKWVGRGLSMAVGGATAAASPAAGVIAGFAVADIQELVVKRAQQDTGAEANSEAAGDYADGRKAIGTSTAQSLRLAYQAAGLDMTQGDINVDSGTIERTAQLGYAEGATWNSSVNDK
ncbi:MULTISPECIES: DUF6571 family protein [unclassified Streptomyces]|uniref:DUF6571 family protein n=1 Tax=unclassified Streptomyces TaxID=2593676 RepID=UPI002E16F9E3|nr:MULTISPECIES: DUF6571 family protein [unclassified Streptomyces]